MRTVVSTLQQTLVAGGGQDDEPQWSEEETRAGGDMTGVWDEKLGGRHGWLDELDDVEASEAPFLFGTDIPTRGWVADYEQTRKG